MGAGSMALRGILNYRSTVQSFNSSTQETETQELIAVTIEQFVAPHAVTKSGTGNRKSFDLARAIKTANANMAMSGITTIFDEWFARSRLFLPRDADRDKSFQTFLKQLTRVRFMASSLKAACERARTATPPFIPALDGNSEATTVATLCRELQRDAGERALFVRSASFSSWSIYAGRHRRTGFSTNSNLTV